MVNSASTASGVFNAYGLAFHHFGLAVKQPSAATAFLDALGYRRGAAIFDPLQGVNLALCEHPSMPAVELIWPGAGEGPSPVDKILAKRDSQLYHLCFTCPEPEQALARLQADGHLLLPAVEAKAAVLFGGVEVSFHYVVGFGLIELIHCDADHPGLTAVAEAGA